MVMKPFIFKSIQSRQTANYLSCCFRWPFWTWQCTTFYSIPIILNLLTNRNIAWIYSVIIWEQKTKELCTVVLMFVGFHNHSPLLTMIWHNDKSTTCDRILNKHMIFVLNGTVVDSDWRFDNLFHKNVI